MGPEIIIVSGLPRSGTSLLMQMLENGGVEVVTDNIRTADTDNPWGYYELEKVKQIKQDTSWLSLMRGKAFKMVSQLLYDLPWGETYRIVFMERDLDEMLDSQQIMLNRLGMRSAPREQMKQSYALHLERLHEWLRKQHHIAVLRVSYNDLVEQPAAQAERVSVFLEGKPDVEKMAKMFDRSLYRNRKAIQEQVRTT